MKWHRRRIPALSRPIQTERFHLKPVGALRCFNLYHKINDDLEILAQFRHTATRNSWRKTYREMERPNGKSRFTYEIITRKEGLSIGFHKLRLGPYRSASLTIVILDKEYWGKGVTAEVRKALLPLFAQSAGVERFWSTVDTRNFASIYNYQNMGFKQSGIMHQSGFDTVRNKPLDFFIFELCKKDFPAYFLEKKT